MTHCTDVALRWRHNGRNGVSNYQPHDCLLNRLFRRRSKKTSKLCVTGLCVGNSPGTGKFPAQMASDAEKVSISWRHHGTSDRASQFTANVTGYHLIQADINKIIKAPLAHCEGDPTATGDSSHKGPLTWEMCSCRSIIMCTIIAHSDMLSWH